MTSEDNRPPTVLVVDDNPTNLRLMFNLLEKNGVKPLGAANGRQGIRYAERARPDLILLDILMPGLDGFETCKILKDSDATKDIPIIFMTAVTDTSQKVRAFDMGAVDYITKPFQTEEVLARVRTQVTLRRQMKLAAEKKKMETLLTLIGGIAHRFNNQLYVVRGNIDLMREDPDMPDSLRRFLDPVETAAEEMTAMTRRLLVFTAYDPPDLSPVSLNLYLKERLAVIAKKLPPEIRVETAFSEQDLMVNLDRRRMETVLLGIIDNAKEAMENGGVIRVATELIKHSGETPGPNAYETAGPDSSEITSSLARVSIADNGVGMDEATRERVFDPFFSTKFLGRGMSMAAAQGIVRGHGGSLSIASAPGWGTVVNIDLPITTDHIDC